MIPAEVETYTEYGVDYRFTDGSTDAEPMITTAGTDERKARQWVARVNGAGMAPGEMMDPPCVTGHLVARTVSSRDGRPLTEWTEVSS